ncbi:MAG TPA: GAF domain-containing protein, partial [Bacteroidetes bacterium]|nr:GAF domain-containing protein [Bacteroidota bacterium]
MSQKINTDALKNLSREELIEKLQNYQQQIAGFRVAQRKTNTLFYIMRNLSQELELDSLLKLVMDEVKDILQADRCTVFLLDDEKDELWSKVGHGLENFEIRFPKSKGIAGYVATTGEVLKIDDCYNSPYFNPEIDRKTGYRTRNMLTVPMRNKKMEVIGVFQVLNKRSGIFTDEDVRMLEAIAPIAAVQLENAQLYVDLRHTLESFILTLSKIVDARDPLTAGHSYRIMLYGD